MKDEERMHHHRPTGAIILIAIGLLFLLNNFGVLPFSVWFVLWRFWPVLLMLFGLKILLGRGKNHEAFTIISLLVILAVFGLAIASVNPSANAWMRVHMPWLSQMMPNPSDSGQMPNRMYRRYWMYNNNGQMPQNFAPDTPVPQNNY